MASARTRLAGGTSARGDVSAASVVVAAEHEHILPQDVRTDLIAYVNGLTTIIGAQSYEPVTWGCGDVEDHVMSCLDEVSRMRVVRRALGSLDDEHRQALVWTYTIVRHRLQVSQIFGLYVGLSVRLAEDVGELLATCARVLAGGAPLQDHRYLQALKAEACARYEAAARQYMPALRLAKSTRFVAPPPVEIEKTSPHVCRESTFHPCPCRG